MGDHVIWLCAASDTAGLEPIVDPLFRAAVGRVSLISGIAVLLSRLAPVSDVWTFSSEFRQDVSALRSWLARSGTVHCVSAAAIDNAACAWPALSNVESQFISQFLVNAAFDQGCWQRRPRSSTAAASSSAPIARAPASPRTGISPKRNRRRRRPHHLRPAPAAPARAGRAGIAPP